jgi:hypothetical protein
MSGSLVYFCRLGMEESCDVHLQKIQNSLLRKPGANTKNVIAFNCLSKNYNFANSYFLFAFY